MTEIGKSKVKTSQSKIMSVILDGGGVQVQEGPLILLELGQLCHKQEIVPIQANWT